MNREIEKSVFLLLSSTNNSFGTAFVVDKDKNGVYLVTCAHVIEACNINSLLVAGLNAKLITMGSPEAIDLALIYVEGLEAIALKLSSSMVKKGISFEVNGFKKHLHQNHKFEMLQGVVKKLSTLYAGSLKIEKYELLFDSTESIEKGYSGSAIICPSSGKVFAVSSSRYSNSHAEAIPITYLKSIWKEIPENLLSDDSCLDKVLESQKSFSILLKKYLLETIGGVIFLGILTSFLYDYIKFSDDTVSNNKNIKQEMHVTGNNNNVKQVINEDSEAKEHCKNGIKLYEKTVNELQEDYENAKMEEIKKLIKKDLKKSQQQLEKFQKKCLKE